jgi:hypothetical protein
MNGDNFKQMPGNNNVQGMAERYKSLYYELATL